MNQYHVVEDICIEDGVLRLVVDGVQVERPLLALSPLLAQASPEQQNLFEVSPSGYGIHWPLLDEDLAIDGLLGVEHTSPVEDELTAEEKMILKLALKTHRRIAKGEWS